MRVHFQESCACTYPGCLKRFSQSSNLITHEKIHSLNINNTYSNDNNNLYPRESEVFEIPNIPGNKQQIGEKMSFQENQVKLLETNLEKIHLNERNLDGSNTISINNEINNYKNFFYQETNNNNGYLYQDEGRMNF